MLQLALDVGGLFLIGSACALIGGYIERRAHNKPVEFDDAVRVLGYVGVVLWVLIGVATISWLISLPFRLLAS